MNLNKKLMLVVILITGFVFGVSLSTFYAESNIAKGTACSCTLPIPVLIPAFSSLGIFIGSIVYYLMVPKSGEKHDTNAFLEMLDPDEKDVIKRLVEHDGKITQSKLSSEIGKVKVFRIVENLKRRNIIEKEPYGKTNLIKLNEKFRKILC